MPNDPDPNAPQSPADVPVARVVLFSSGVGFFEHAGSMSGDSSTELRFKSEQINDILKSLVLHDAGGQVSSVVYPSQDPLAKTLKSFAVDITENPSLADLLNQLRGAKVTASLGTDKAAGTILGVERRQRPVGDHGIVDYWVMNLVSGATIRSVSLEDLRQLELDEPRLQEELTRALAALAQARDQDKKPIIIRFAGEGTRAVRIGYVVEAPVWKTSYRLLLPDPVDNDAAGSKPATTLQGWAIVENQTDNDWKGVALSLVSGRPISFIQELYQPLYVSRPVVQPELYGSLRPQAYSAGIEEMKDQVPGSGGAASPAAPAPPQSIQAMARRSAKAAPAYNVSSGRPIERSFDASRGVASQAESAQVGELFQYTVAGVSLPRQKSAMIPIVTDDIEAERLSIYNHAVLAKNPLYGARITNTTGKHLLQGPVTVLDAGSYAGDARIDNLPPGQHRLISYGIDLQVHVQHPAASVNTAIQTGKILKGTLSISQRRTVSQDYLFDSKAPRSKTLIVEHPIQPNFTLFDTPDPAETTDQVYRFRLDVEPSKQAKLTVKTEWVYAETLAILDGAEAPLLRYSSSAKIPAAVRAALADALRRKQALAATERQIQDRRTKLADLATEQERLRDNLKSVPEKSPYYTRLLNKLNEQENTIERLQAEIETHQKTRDKEQTELEEYLGGLDVQ
jgi:hypothetical protein